MRWHYRMNDPALLAGQKRKKSRDQASGVKRADSGLIEPRNYSCRSSMLDGVKRVKDALTPQFVVCY